MAVVGAMRDRCKLAATQAGLSGGSEIRCRYAWSGITDVAGEQKA